MKKHEMTFDGANRLDTERCREKKEFKSKPAAKAWARAIKRDFGSRQHAYKCPRCTWWHLTTAKGEA